MRSRGPSSLVGLAVGVLFLISLPDAARGELSERLPDDSFQPVTPILAEDVFDPIFAFLMGVLDRHLYGDIDAAFFDSLATVEGGSKMPYDKIVRMERQPRSFGVDAAVIIEMGEQNRFDIPYSILGYHPGEMRFAERIEMLDWHIGDRRFELEFDGGKEMEVVEARDSHLLVIAEGSIEFDIDGWLDRMLGGRLDDVSMTGFYVFRHEGRSIGLGFGYNKGGKGRTGAFDFTDNESMFPAGRAYLAVGREMRTLAEQRLERWKIATSRSSSTEDPGATAEHR